MTKRWSLNTLRCAPGQFAVLSIDCDWAEPYPRLDGSMGNGWFCVSVIVLGFGVLLTYWRYADVYGDGGVA